jgi:hypothetical protein
MEMIRIHLTGLQNEPHVQLHKEVIIGVEKNLKPEQIEALGLKPLLERYKRAHANETSALDIIIKSKFTPLMTAADKERDDVCRLFITTIKGLCYHFDDEIRQAAQRVMDIINHYGNIPQRPLDDETAAIEDLGREFERPDLAADLVTLNAVPYLSKLLEKNEAYAVLTRGRIEESASQTAYRMKSARVATDKYYRSIIQHLEYLITVETDAPEFKTLIAELNKLVKHYKDILAQKKGQSNAKKQNADMTENEE